MSYLFVLFSFLFAFQPQPTPTDSGGLSITVTGQVELPADQVQFNINVNAEAETPQAAYDLHKKREQALVDLLDKYQIKEEDIRYEPISISKIRNYDRENNEKPLYQTRQGVSLNLSDFEIFEKIQIGLIENSFDNFNANFTSSEMEAGKEKALKAAIAEAREKAEMIAKEAGVNVGSIQQISYGAGRSPAPNEAYEVKMMAADSGGMMKYEQTVTVSATISMKFALTQ